MALSANNKTTKESNWLRSKTPGPYGKTFWVNERTGMTHYGESRPQPASTMTNNVPIAESDQRLQQQHSQQQPNQVISPICLQCSLVVRDSSPYVILNHRRVHVSCFLCHSCHVSLAKTDCMKHRAEHFCVPCYEKLHAPRCCGCKKICKVGEKLIVHANRLGISMIWHTHCRVACKDCGNYLEHDSLTNNRKSERCTNCEEIYTNDLRISRNEVLLLCGKNQNTAAACCQIYRRTSYDRTFLVSSSIEGIVGTTMAMFDEFHLYVIAGDSLYCMELDKITHHVTTAIEINSLFLVQNVIGDQHEMMRNSVSGLRGQCKYGDGFLCIAPRGSLASSDRDSIVWVDKETAEVHVLLQTELRHFYLVTYFRIDEIKNQN
jgi:hypothetical protein